MLPAFICHIPSGASLKQFLHYGQEIQFGFFGKYMEGSEKPVDFPLSKITTPLSLHYSSADELVDTKDARILISKLKNCKLHVQAINQSFNHIDFIWGSNAASLIYSKILIFFNKYK